ncbi:SDR family oxidoreductase [Marinoscillum furvescens]|uniref:3-oxoacyl-[acyl-carrier protein] reductase n=1 Tax=Marinoscillum furvescens DSM 4134 TaxID=1122208 RepID=A0A3D9KXI6_MARFU|nr:SDR family oxidoreductase [Marinoscillum furvescens]RED93628.1 3-oxoacyl-[acyl-carrier protein] reductase [Marinoscillum furvescens DSM 4134]
MDLNLKSKKALVCGASQGIGAAIAEALAAEGAQVVIVSRTAADLERQLQRLAGEGHHYQICDLDQPEDVSKLETFVKEYQPDIIVNNAGGPAPGPVASATIEEFELAISRHLHASHRLLQAALPAMKDHKFGRFIQVISTSVKMPIAGLGVSNTTRGAMASWSKTLSMEVAQYGITVNNILPGAVDTGRLRSIIANTAEKQGISEEQAAKNMEAGIPAGRFGVPAELGDLAVFLASDKAAYITGVSIPVDGGRTGCL